MRSLAVLALGLSLAACSAGTVGGDGGLDGLEVDGLDGDDGTGPDDGAGADDGAGDDGLPDAADGGEDAAEDGDDGAGGDDGGPVFGAELYVATWGDDLNPGTRELPFATLERAREEVRARRAQGLPEGGLVVWLRGGLYLRAATLELGAEDSGEEGRPVVWASAPGESARLAGATLLDPAGWQAVEPGAAAWDRLDASAQGQVVALELPGQGLTDYGALSPRGFYAGAGAALELFADGAPLELARWPDPDEDDPPPTPQDPVLTLFGQPVPDVSGTYQASGTADGVNAYQRAGLVGGLQYHLYRHTWDYQGNSYTAWFLATQSSGYPGDADPWWYLYSAELGRLAPSNGAVGEVSPIDPAALNHGFASIDQALDDTSFTYRGDRPARWATAEEVWLHGYWMYMWADLHVRAAAIDHATRTVTLSQVPGYGIAAGQPFYAENLLEEITRPGEWYLDRGSGRLYLWPPAPLAGVELLASTLDGPLVRVRDGAHVVLQDLVLEDTRRELAVIEGGHDVQLLGCELRNAGTRAAVVSGSRNGLERCRVHDCGDSGVELSGGERSSLTRAGNYVRNTDFQRFARWSWTYQPAVRLSGCGQVVAHNRMRQAPHSAILYSGNEHLIELNEIAEVCRYSSDAGAIYTGRDWGYRGNVVRHNFIHDLETFFQGYGVHGVYLDDCVSGIEVTGNVLYRISGLGIEHGGGRDDLMTNNVIARCGGAMSGDNRGLLWITHEPGDSWNLLERLAADGIQYQAEPWASAYPALAAIPNDWAAISDPAQRWREPEGSVFSRNLGFANGEWMIESIWAGDAVFARYAEIADNIADEDPL
ncbi:MAG TPA: right-handed parallel beta-helix repeat-containing protein, partial [Myxococcota bacterium]|nr:right-handed parallel beta-helix repeat-containing protein [Myxococcota bacterium]